MLHQPKSHIIPLLMQPSFWLFSVSTRNAYYLSPILQVELKMLKCQPLRFWALRADETLC
jgi:hypothetical protein